MIRVDSTKVFVESGRTGLTGMRWDSPEHLHDFQVAFLCSHLENAKCCTAVCRNVIFPREDPEGVDSFVYKNHLFVIN